MRFDRQNSTVDYPEAIRARYESNGGLTLLKSDIEKLGSIAQGC
jgi:hypothetical protein